MSIINKIFLVPFLCWSVITVSVAWAVPFQVGDVFIGVGNGRVQHRNAGGILLETLDTRQGNFTTGMAFDTIGNLYVTNYQAGNVRKFDNKGNLIGTFGSGYNLVPESILFDRKGNAYVGDADHDLLKFDSQGTPLARFDIAEGPDCIELAADQCTMLYTSQGNKIKRFDVCANKRLADFNAADLPVASANNLRILPTGSVLVADLQTIVRLDASGNITRFYDVPGQNCWYGLSLDPDRKSFWSADECTSNVYKLDIETGQPLLIFNTGTGSFTVYGLAVYGEEGNGGGNYSPPGLLSNPEQPVPPPPPPSVTVPSGNHKYLVLLIHGYNSDPSVWAESMKTEIVNQLGGSSGDACLNPIPKGNISWQICTLDWSQLAGDLSLLKGPWFAYDNARIVGQSLAKTMVDKQLNYDFIHFIAHSAGSQVADTAATWLPRFINDHNAQSGDHLIKPIIHTTFLDAYDPSTTLLDGSPYGMSSDWAEQYVDTRRVVVPVIDDTNLTLAGSYNFDITALDPNSNDVPGTEAHAWPYKWYQETVKDPASSAFGFSLSRESGGQFPSNLPKGGKCVFTPNGICSDSGVVAAIATVKVVIDNMADPIASALASATGYIVFLSDQLIKITTGSPAWVSLPINVPEPIDVLTFDYTYQRQAEGLLSVFFDDQLVYRSDQRFEPASLNHSDNVPIGAIASGAHKLSFRLDAFNNTQSEIDISRIQLGKIEVSEQVDTTPPIITPTVSGTQGNNGWYKSDVTVSWTVVDSESAITTQIGCGTTTVTADTAGVTFTCSATSGGGTASKSVTIQRDATPPVITESASPAANTNGWRKSSVTVSFTCTDATSGVATCTGPQTLGEGANQSVSGTVIDKAGNTATTQVMGINVDMTPPVIAGMPTACTLWPPNHKMVQVATVTATDALSGVAPGSFSVTGTSNEPSNSADPDIVIKPNGSDGFTVQLRADRLGTGTGRIYTITATATDRGGNTATSTATCTVPHDQGQGN